MIVVKESQPAAFGLDDRPLVVDAAPDVWDGQTRLLRHVDKLDR